MAIYIKGLLTGTAMSIGTLVLFFLVTNLVAYLRMTQSISAEGGFVSGDSMVTFSLFWPLLLAALAFRRRILLDGEALIFKRPHYTENRT